MNKLILVLDVRVTVSLKQRRPRDSSVRPLRPQGRDGENYIRTPHLYLSKSNVKGIVLSNSSTKGFEEDKIVTDKL